MALLSVSSLGTASASPVSGAVSSHALVKSYLDNSQISLQQRIDVQLATSPGAVQISPYEVAWDGGRVIMSFPRDGQKKAPPVSQAARNLMRGLDHGEQAPRPQASPQSIQPQDIEGCPTEIFGADWYCFYQDINWLGRRLQWSDPMTVDFRNFNFDNEASSWVNGGALIIEVFDDNSENGVLWVEEDHVKSSSVPCNDCAGSFIS